MSTLILEPAQVRKNVAAADSSGWTDATFKNVGWFDGLKQMVSNVVNDPIFLATLAHDLCDPEGHRLEVIAASNFSESRKRAPK